MLSIFSVLVLLTVTICLIYFLTYMARKFDYWKCQNVPFLKPVPIFGNIFEVCSGKASLGTFCASAYKKTKGAFIGAFILDEPCLIVKDLDLIRDILVTNFDHFENRSIANNDEHDPVGSNMLLLLKTPKWTGMRKKITPAFTSTKLKQWMSEMEAHTLKMIEYIEKKMKKDNVIDIFEIFSMYTTDVYASFAYGYEANCFINEKSPFREASHVLMNVKYVLHAIQVTCFYIATKWVKPLHMKFIHSDSAEFLTFVFRKSVEERREKRDDVMDKAIEMLENNETDIQRAAGLVTSFFAAGYETNSSALSFVLWEISRNSDIQKKLRNEIINVKKKFQNFSYEAVQEMDYLEQVLFESSRKYPIFPFLDRRCNMDYPIPGTDIVLKKGDIVYIPVLGIHHDEEYYPNSQCFDPERFNRDNCRKRHKMAFLPFGEGPRYCIGKRLAILNLKLAVACILEKFEVNICSLTGREIDMNMRGFMLHPKRGVYIKFDIINRTLE